MSSHLIKCFITQRTGRGRQNCAAFVMPVRGELSYRIFRPITRALSIQKGSEIVKNEYARYKLERFPTDNARVICTKKILENTILCIKHNFQLKLVCSIHSVALLSQGTVLQLTTDH